MLNSVIQVLPRLISAKFIIPSVEHEKTTRSFKKKPSCQLTLSRI